MENPHAHLGGGRARGVATIHTLAHAVPLVHTIYTTVQVPAQHKLVNGLTRDPQQLRRPVETCLRNRTPQAPAVQATTSKQRSSDEKQPL